MNPAAWARHGGAARASSLLLTDALASGCAREAPRSTPPAPTRADPTGAPATEAPATPGGPAAPSAGPGTDATGASGTAGVLPVGRLLFDSDRSGNLDIWYLQAGSTDAVQVTSDEGDDRTSAWHPDGSSVIFASDRLGGPSVPSGGALRAYGLFIAHLDRSEDRHLLGTRTFNGGVSYSPDGSRIVFVSDLTGTTQVYLLDPEYRQFAGPEPIVLTSDDHNDAPAWSPDGTRLAFRSLRDGNAEIYVMDADGSNQQRLTEDPGDDSSPAWSPDGSRIAFHSDRAGGRHVFVMKADGSDVTQITTGDVRDGFPSWSPDGEWLAFDRQVTRDDVEILVIRLDGSELINVTNDAARDAFPAWGP